MNEFYAFASLDGYSPGVDLVPALREGGRRILAKAKALADKEGIRAKTLMRETLGGPRPKRSCAMRASSAPT